MSENGWPLSCVKKVRYWTRVEALAAWERTQGHEEPKLYMCSHCQAWHLGNVTHRPTEGMWGWSREYPADEWRCYSGGSVRVTKVTKSGPTPSRVRARV